MQIRGGERITCVALYGLLDDLSDSSVHRSFSEVSPIFSDPRYKERVIVGGDLNLTTQLSNEHGLLDRARGVLDLARKTAAIPIKWTTSSPLEVWSRAIASFGVRRSSRNCGKTSAITLRLLRSLESRSRQDLAEESLRGRRAMSECDEERPANYSNT
jgi:hypothetical protein